MIKRLLYFLLAAVTAHGAVECADDCTCCMCGCGDEPDICSLKENDHFLTYCCHRAGETILQWNDTTCLGSAGAARTTYRGKCGAAVCAEKVCQHKAKKYTDPLWILITVPLLCTAMYMAWRYTHHIFNKTQSKKKLDSYMELLAESLQDAEEECSNLETKASALKDEEDELNKNILAAHKKTSNLKKNFSELGHAVRTQNERTICDFKACIDTQISLEAKYPSLNERKEQVHSARAIHAHYTTEIKRARKEIAGKQHIRNDTSELEEKEEITRTELARAARSTSEKEQTISEMVDTTTGLRQQVARDKVILSGLTRDKEQAERELQETRLKLKTFLTALQGADTASKADALEAKRQAKILHATLKNLAEQHVFSDQTADSYKLQISVVEESITSLREIILVKGREAAGAIQIASRLHQNLLQADNHTTIATQKLNSCRAKEMEFNGIKQEREKEITTVNNDCSKTVARIAQLKTDLETMEGERRGYDLFIREFENETNAIRHRINTRTEELHRETSFETGLHDSLQNEMEALSKQKTKLDTVASELDAIHCQLSSLNTPEGCVEPAKNHVFQTIVETTKVSTAILEAQDTASQLQKTLSKAQHALSREKRAQSHTLTEAGKEKLRLHRACKDKQAVLNKLVASKGEAK